MPKSFKAAGKKLSRSYIFLYTALFAVAAAIVFYPFIKGGRSLIWNPDGVAQHYTAFVYFGRYVRELLTNIFHGSFVFPQWDFSIGLGSDILTSLHYYSFGDPLNLISALIPERLAPWAFSAIMALRYYLSGLAFVLLCRHKRLAPGGVSAAAVFYTFNYYSLCLALRHPSFLNPMIYFPLIILGIEMMFEKKRPYLFIAMIFVATASSFYFFYVISMFTVLYIFIRLFFQYKKEGFIKNAFIDFLRFGGGYLLGVLMAAVIFLPVVSVFLGSARSGVEYELTAFYKPEYYVNFITSFATPYVPYTNTYLGYSSLACVGILMLFTKFSKDKKRIFLQVAFVILTIFMMLPVVSKIANGFSYVTNRWSWVYCLLVAYIFAYEFRELKKIRLYQAALLFLGAGIFMVAAYLNHYVRRRPNYLCGVLFIMIAAGIFVYWAIGKLRQNKFTTILKKTFTAFVAVACIGGVLINEHYTFSPKVVKTRDEYLTYDEAVKLTQDNGFAAIKDIQNTQTAIERFGVERTLEDLGDLNNSILLGTHGETNYLSLSDGKVNMFFKDLGLVTNSFSLFEGSAADPFVASALNIKYYGSRDYTTVNYGFRGDCLGKITTNSSYRDNMTYELYENKNYIPFGCTFKNVISADDYQSLGYAQRRVSLIDTLVIGETDEFVNSGTEHINEKCTDVPYDIELEGDGVYMNGNKLYVSKASTIVRLKTDTPANSQVYCVLKNIRFIPTVFGEIDEITINQTDELTPEQRASIKPMRKGEKLPRSRWVDVMCNRKAFSANLTDPSYDYHSGITDFSANLGYTSGGIKEIQLKFGRGVYEFDDIEIVSVDMSTFKAEMQARAKDSLKNLKLETNKISGEITAGEDEFLYLSIPYSKYWTATVDGEKAQTYCANTAFTAIKLDAGEHKIELKYSNTVIKYSAVLSAAGFLTFAALIAIIETKKKKKKQ